MDNQRKEVAKLIAGTLSNVAVVGFGLAIYDNRLGALVAGAIAIAIAIGITWRAER